MQTQKELEKQLKQLVNAIDEAEQKAVEFALEHNLDIYLGEYGESGRRLLLTDEEAEYYGLSRGDWLYSSQTC